MTPDSSPAISLEFFPPRDEAAQERMLRAAKQMTALAPRYVSVTFGAGGSTREGTVNAVRTLRNLGLDAAPHLSCVGATPASLRELLALYRDMGVRRIVALRGDMPSGMGAGVGNLRHASDLVAFIRQETGDTFHLEVAAYPETHPEAVSPAQDLAHFVEKMKAGADSAITQYFFNPDAYFDFVERASAQGVSAPIVPGIMPITNYSQLQRFSDMCGAEIPRWVRLRLASFGDDRESIRAFGQEVVSDLCRRLLAGGAPGLHFYTLNQADATRAICQDLGIGQ
ncbi:methylenetetrahydrofolate reductase [NAD(P)H] [Verticiella sediminum]|uniref:Methylenetetrahydrofolate reductase n=1 Tax=Verticiella sediminum TaxID=1247510 RepID=A0A556AFB9_9BURK|nr:methylenetetrahydrofolate reductase [NAD(P)H] [Verticiella sediminum]TSH91578.1 methylenetetrahydrofolate reductase [NAD(P)H] [Verticiella sediminum]